MQLVADQRSELVDYVRVADIPLLRCGRQGKVVKYQPGHGSGFVLAHAVLETKRLAVHGAEFRVIATTALGDVVEQA